MCLFAIASDIDIVMITDYGREHLVWHRVAALQSIISERFPMQCITNIWFFARYRTHAVLTLSGQSTICSRVHTTVCLCVRNPVSPQRNHCLRHINLRCHLFCNFDFDNVLNNCRLNKFKREVHNFNRTNDDDDDDGGGVAIWQHARHTRAYARINEIPTLTWCNSLSTIPIGQIKKPKRNSADEEEEEERKTHQTQTFRIGCGFGSVHLDRFCFSYSCTIQACTLCGIVFLLFSHSHSALWCSCYDE